MQKILVAYYTRSGHTQTVAEEIARTCDADLETIRDVRDRGGFFGYMRSGREAWREQLAEIQPVEKDPEQYDLVVLGTPVWAGKISSPMRTYVTQQGGRFTRVAFFCTEGGSGGKRALRQLEVLCDREPLARMIVTERELKSGSYRQKVSEFTRTLAQPTD